MIGDGIIFNPGVAGGGQVTIPVPITQGGTGQITARAAAAALGVPFVLKQSAVASSITGTLTETALATITVPADALGPNGRLRITTLWTYTNSSNNKILRTRVGGIAGVAPFSSTLTTTASCHEQTEWANRNATNSQVAYTSSHAVGSFIAGSGANFTSALDTTASFDVVITGQLANTGETITLEYYIVELYNGA